MYFGRDHETDFVLTSRVNAEFEYVAFFLLLFLHIAIDVGVSMKQFF